MVNTDRTSEFRVLSNHKRYDSGKVKTICVSTCLNFFGISVDKYNYTSGKVVNSYENVLRRFSYNVRSRMSELKIKRGDSLTTVKTSLRKSKYNASDYFIIYTYKSKIGHLLVLNGNGDVVIDTAKGGRWKVISVKNVFKN